MADTTPNLSLPFLFPSQADKHVSVNEGLSRLDTLVQLRVISYSQTAQPSSAADGSSFILPVGKTGSAWSQIPDNSIATWRDNAWTYHRPLKGWRAFVDATNEVIMFDGMAWSQLFERSALGLGSAATANIGTSGAKLALLNGANTWAQGQIFASNCAQQTPTDSIFQIQTTGPIQSAAVELAADNLSRRWSVVASGSGLGGNALLIRSGDWIGGTTRLSIDASGHILPGADGNANLGAAGKRYATLYATNGVISTSDAREKTPLSPLPIEVLRAVCQIMPQIGVFQWQDSIACKGPNAARFHIGVTAQTVRDAFEEQGLDPDRWGLFCRDMVASGGEDPSGTDLVSADMQVSKEETSMASVDLAGQTETKEFERLGIRVDQLLWLAIAALSRNPLITATHEGA
jgi:hypothetical protein